MELPKTTERRKFAFQTGFWAASALLDLLLPPACRLCGDPTEKNSDFCRTCWIALTQSDNIMRTACPRCGRPGGLTTHPKPTSNGRETSEVLDLGANKQPSDLPANVSDGPSPKPPLAACVHCKKEKFQFDHVIARWTYQDRVCDAIVAAKHASQSALGNALGRQLGEKVLEKVESDQPDRITYVPSNFRRQLARGGRNGNVAIAEAVAKHINNVRFIEKSGERIRLQPLLRTTRRIKKQAWLSDVQRRENVSGAFAAKKGYAWPMDFRILAGLSTFSEANIRDQHILVVDDVLTTGATANEVSKVLRDAGARRVTLAVVARAVWSK